MTSAVTALRFGTRSSALALWQTQHVMALLTAAHPGLIVSAETFSTRGDQALDTPLPLIGGKGVFTAELEAALHDKRIDCAVHSLKDLPTAQPDGLAIGAMPPRANPADVLISRAGHTLDSLPEGAVIGTSSYRRASQLLHKRPDLKLIDIRGNVETRIRKALASDGAYDAIVLAYAGLERLGRLEVVAQVLELDAMLPAPGQGAIAVQTRHEPALLEVLAPLQHADTVSAVTAERAFLSGLGGGCSVPVAAYAWHENDQLHLWGRVCSNDGTQRIDVRGESTESSPEAAYALGVALAGQALSSGASALMDGQA